MDSVTKLAVAVAIPMRLGHSRIQPAVSAVDSSQLALRLSRELYTPGGCRTS
jgi:hypothetical protein